MLSYINVDELQLDPDTEEKLERLFARYRKHEFNLLGSGYVRIGYVMRAKGAYGHRYISKADKLIGNYARIRLKGICSRGYDPINWFIDYKSGYLFDPVRYRTKKRCENAIGRFRGVDIKCPWEMGRLYHIVRLAVLASFDDSHKREIISEYKNTIEDFICMNPVGKTVQWSAPMDVAIRIVSLVMSYDIISQTDCRGLLNGQFGERVEKHVYDSLRYLMDNLEYAGKFSSNHYLSNVAGVIFASAYLPSDEWTDACLAFGAQELIDQTMRQFHLEGSNFEGSTSYHRLSAELVLYSTALLYGVFKSSRRKALFNYDHTLIERLRAVNRQKYSEFELFSNDYTDRLFNMGFFTSCVMKQNNEVVQVGDNDSGRLVKLTPFGNSEDENEIDHRGLLSAMCGLFQGSIFEEYGKQFPLEKSIIRALSDDTKLSAPCHEECKEIRTNDSFDINQFSFYEENTLFEDSLGISLLNGASLYWFEEFGIVIVESDRLFLSVVIDTTKNTNLTGHTHNDKLSIELMVDGNYITRDPGGYVYTAAPEIRDLFRSTAAHNTIFVSGVEQNKFDGVFGLKRMSTGELLMGTCERILAKASYGGVNHVRDIHITDNRILVKDYANKPFKVKFGIDFYSYGYGKMKGKIRNDR